jgi:N-acetylglucosamine-6-sulfatase
MALAILMVLTMSAAGAEEEPGRPDIVVIFLDDVDPHDGRVWRNEKRTPTLSSLFAKSGVQFTNAVAETPLCSPGRANTLTGQHTLNHRVDANVTKPFDPRVTIGTELQESGYQTLFVGKYMNQLRSEVKRKQLRRYAQGWDEFDIVYQDNGRYRDYDMWTREGMQHYGKKPSDHLTLVTKRRVVKHLAEASTDEPVFAFVSIFDLHAPNRPTVRYDGDKRCRNIKPWNPPSFDADVSTKPKYVRKRPAPSKDGWPMTTYCEEMLGVDELVGAVVRQQSKRGRLDDTLFVFTADNGVAWGTHRQPQRKGVPYATPIPMVFSWPARWGEEPVRIDEVVSNIDLAPTFCAIAGCEMGPFENGQAAADGLDLLPLLDGEVDHLERSVVREQSGPGYIAAPEFWAIRSTSQHPLGRWHYVEYETGERELYDSVMDPWELDNLADSEEHQDVVSRLSAELHLEFPELAEPGDAPA